MKLEETTNVALDAKEFAFLLSAVSFGVSKTMRLDPGEQLSITLSFAMAADDLGNEGIKNLGERLKAHFDAAWGEHYDILSFAKESATETVQEPASGTQPENPAQEVA